MAADPSRVRTRAGFARELTALRERAGLTVREVAKAAGEPNSTVGGYFSGRYLPPMSRPEVLTKILHACGVTDPAVLEEWIQAFGRVRRAPGPRPADAPVPYRGLASFQPEDADWFFGRERLTRLVIARLAAGHATGDGLVVVVGPSGSGKSSALRAGVIPAVRAGALGLPSSPTWPVLLFTPGAEPLRHLAEQLAARTTDGTTTEELRNRLRIDPSFCRVLARQVAATSRQPLVDTSNGATGLPEAVTTEVRGAVVLVVDQFEEVFTACPDEDERRAFVAALSAVARHEDIAPGFAAGTIPPPALVVLGMRADFYRDALRYPRLERALQENQVVVGPMTEDELRRAIIEPARKARLDLEDGLVELLLRDLAPPAGHHPTGTDDRSTSAATGSIHEAGALPLLSHALLATWQRSQRGRLSLADYRDSGGIHRGVARTADAVYQRLSEAQRALARRLFVRLVQVADNAADTRRRLPRQALLAEGQDTSAAELAQVLDRFVEQRLITVDKDTVEITHDALLAAWPRLRSWIEADRAGLLLNQQLTQTAEAWQHEHRDPSWLYHGTRLSAVLGWRQAGHEHDLTPLAREFLDASIRRARRRTRRLYQTIAALMALLLGAIAAGGVAYQQRAAAAGERNRAISRLVATRADRLRDKDVPLARLLSVAAYRIAPTLEARSSLLDSSATMPATRILGPPGIMQWVALSPGRRLLASGNGDKTVRLWDLNRPGRPAPLGSPLTGFHDIVYTVAFSRDGQMLAAGSGDKTVRVWDVADPAHPAPLGPVLTGPGALVYSVAFAPNGRILAAASGDHTVRLWRLGGGSGPTPLGRPLTMPGTYVQTVAFSPDGRTLAAGDDQHTVQLWDVGDPGHAIRLGSPLKGPAKRVFSVAFSPDGRTIAAGSSDNAVYLWDVTDRAHPAPLGAPLTGPTSWVNAVAFSPDGSALAAGSSDGAVRVWDLATKRLTATLPHPGPVTGVAYGQDNDTVATSAADGVARLWSLPGPILHGPDQTVNGVAFSPDGGTLAVASTEAQLWSVRERRPLSPPLTNRTGFSGTVAYSPDGRTLAVGGSDGTVQLWSVADPTHPAKLGPAFAAHPLLVESMAFRPGGGVLATASDDNTVRLWDVTNPARRRLLATLTGFTSYVYSVAFSPDGRILAAGSIDKTVRLWDVTNLGRPAPLAAPLTGPDHYVLAVAFSPDGHTLAVGSADKTLRLWDVTNPRRPAPIGRPLAGPTNYVYSLSFSPDGRRLAAANTDATVWLWDVADPHRPSELASLAASSGPVYSVAFGKDNRTVAAGGGGKAVWLWDTDPEQIAAAICAAAGDGITDAEWRQYVPGLPYNPPCRSKD